MYRAIKVRIYPTDDQESYLAECFGNTRWLWNYMLNATTTAYQETGKGLSKAAMDKLLPALKKEYENSLTKTIILKTVVHKSK